MLSYIVIGSNQITYLQHIENTLAEAFAELKKLAPAFPTLQFDFDLDSYNSVNLTSSAQRLQKLAEMCTLAKQQLERQVAHIAMAVQTSTNQMRELELELAKIDNATLRINSQFDAELQTIDKESATYEAQLSVLQSQIDNRTADENELKEKVANVANEISQVRFFLLIPSVFRVDVESDLCLFLGECRI